MAVEICVLFGKLSDRLSVISFAGFGYFLFLKRELVPIVRLHIYILLHFTFEFSGGAIPIPRLIISSNGLSLGHIGRSNGLFPRAFFKKKTLIKLDY